MTHLKIFLLLIICALSVLDGKAQTGIALTNELDGKQIEVIGDSHVKNRKESFENTWRCKFAEKHGMEYFSYGENENSIAYSSPRWGEAVYLRYVEIADSLSYAIIIGGRNDAFRLDSIGDIDDFKDKMGILCKSLVEKYPAAKTFFFTHWSCKNSKESSSKKVVDTTIEVCGNYSIPIFDCARKRSTYADNDTFRRIYFQKSRNSTDTAHLNSKEHDRFLGVIRSFLLQY